MSDRPCPVCGAPIDEERHFHKGWAAKSHWSDPLPKRPKKPAVLLRDTPEDRERLAQAIRRAEYPDTEHGANYRDDRKADAILAALRGEG